MVLSCGEKSERNELEIQVLVGWLAYKEERE
jgi:hypothetical protein